MVKYLVTDDMLGLSGFYPKFVKKYASLDRIIEKAVKKYSKDIKLGKFPSSKNFFKWIKENVDSSKFSEKIIYIFKKNKIKIYFLFAIIIIFILSLPFFSQLSR